MISRRRAIGGLGALGLAYGSLGWVARTLAGSAHDKTRAPDLASRLLQLHAAEAEGNAAISPYSLLSALALLSRAADGRTLRGLEQHSTLIPDKLVAERLPLRSDPVRASELLSFAIQNPGAGNILRSANGLWLAEDVLVQDEFELAPLDAEQMTLPATSTEVLEVINQWVSDKTRGFIPSILDTIDEQTRLILTNALYFKGQWLKSFNPEDTAREPFRLANGSTDDVEMMRSEDYVLPHWKQGPFEAVRLPFYGGRIEYVVLTTTEPMAPAEILSELNSASASGGNDTLGSILRGDNSVLRRGLVAIPRHQVDSSIDLAPSLQQLGLAEPFDTCADFSRLSDERLSVDQVAHRARLDVSEEGAEAAAATAITGVRSALPAPEPGLEFVLDRPFVSFLVSQGMWKIPLIQSFVSNPAAA